MTRRPRVLVLTPDFPPTLGGIQLLMHRLVTSMPGIEPRVVTLDGHGSKEFDEKQEFRVVRVGGRLTRRASILRLNARALREALAFRPDVVLCGHIVTAPAATAIRRALGVPVVLYVYAQELPAKPALARFALKNADAIVAISHHTRALALAMGGDPNRLVLIPPGVDLPADPTPKRRDQPTILTIARLHDRYKGHDVMLRALPLIRARVPDARWVVIGDGRLRSELETYADGAGLNDHVRFLGSVSDTERDHWLRTARVFCMPSRLQAGVGGGEGFGIVYMEASAHGLPVVAGNVGGAVDAVDDGRTGLLVDPTDHVAVADALGDLLVDRERAEQIGAQGIGHAQDFAYAAIGPRLQEIIVDLAQGRQGSAPPNAASGVGATGNGAAPGSPTPAATPERGRLTN